jgi:hypothetical protein
MLITEEYKQLNEQLHQDPKYGSRRRSAMYTQISDLMGRTKSDTLLDYGCGKGEMARHLPATCYDPCVAQFSSRPTAHDLVACCDVLEHIEPNLLDNVLADIASLTNKAVYLVISTRLAVKVLADGRNAHLIVKGKDWWSEQLGKHFAGWDMDIKHSNASELTVIGVKHGSR